MAAVDSDESDFGDDMVLVPSMKLHTGGQGLGAASAPAAAVPLVTGPMDFFQTRQRSL